MKKMTLVRVGRTTRLTATVLAVAMLAACDSSTGPKQGEPPKVLNALPRALTATETKVRDASNDFSFALLSALTESQAADNTFISPLSVSFALGMTMNGARDQTLTEIQTALRLSGMSQDEINAGFKSLTQLLLSIDPSTEMRIANALFYRTGFAVSKNFLDTTKEYFNATGAMLDFSKQDDALSIINSVVSDATNGKIKKVLSAIDPNHMMFIINAIYFKGSWRDKFDPKLSLFGPFTPAVGAPQSVAFMNRRAQMSYADRPTYQAVDLPYGNSAFSMTVILPKPGQDVNVVARSFNTASWRALTTSWPTLLVNLALPRLKLEYDKTLNSDLQALGMRVPFTPAANFSGLSTGPLRIDFVKQNSFVDINEEGTEAAAVTTVGVVAVSLPVEVTMKVDRPYLFVIRERLSGTVLFMGKIVRMPPA